MFVDFSPQARLFLPLLICAVSPSSGREPEFDLVPQMIHEYALNDIAYAPDGLSFAGASYDRVLLWEVNTGKQIRVFPGMGKGFTCVAFSPDGGKLAAGATDKTAVIWDLDTGKLEMVLEGHGYEVRDIAFSPDSRSLASVASRWAVEEKDKEEGAAPSSKARALLGEAGNLLAQLNKVKSGELKIWDMETGAEKLSFAQQYVPVEPICFSPDGLSIAGGGIDFTLGQWELATGHLMRIFTRFNHRLQAVAFSPDGSALAGAYWGKDRNRFPARGVQVWNVADSTVRHDFSGYTGFVQALAFSPDGKYLVTAANDFKAYLPEKRKKRSKVLPLNDRNSDRSKRGKWEKFAADKDQVRVRNRDGSYTINRHSTAGYKLGELKLWRAADGADLGTFVRDSSPIYTVAFGPDGHVVSDSKGYTIKRRNAANLEVTHSVQGLTAEVQDLVFSPDCRLVANLDMSNSFRVWDVANLRKVHLFRGHEGRINAVAFSPDSRRIASSSEDKTIRIWDMESGDQLHILKCEKYPRGLAFSPDGRRLVNLEWPHLGLRTLREKRLAWWDLGSGQEIRFKDKRAWDIKKEKYNHVAFSGDGRFLLLSAGYRNLGRYEYASTAPTDLWDVDTGRPVHRFETADAADYSSDGRHIATARGAKMELWDVRTHEKVRDFSGHEAWSGMRLNVKQELGITSVAISPDGAWLVSCGMDKTMRLWDLKTGANIRTLAGRFQLARFSPKGDILVSADFDGRLELRNMAHLTSERGYVPPAVTLIGLPESEDFIAFTPDLKYKSTRNGYKAIVILKNNRAYGFDQFDALLNRPDLVLAALPGSDPNLVASYRRAYETRLAKLGLREDQLALDFHLPELTITRSDPPGKTRRSRVGLEVTVSDDRYPLDRLLVWVNGVPLYGRRGLDLRGRGRHYTTELTVDLAHGPNTIELSTMNSRAVESYRRTLYFERGGEPPKPDLYLVAIGVSDYSRDGPNRDLVYAGKDARDLIALMKGHRDLFGQVFTLELLNGEATRENIRRTRAFLERAGVDDQVVFFMAGHGLLDANRDFYFGTTDIDFADPATRGFAYAEIENLMDGLSARRKLVLIDACHSGEAEMETGMSRLPAGPLGPGARGFKKKKSQPPASAALENGFDLVRDLFVDLNRGSGTMVISSARGNEFAFESDEWQNGAFTRALLEGLRIDERRSLPRSDLDENRRVDIAELRRFAMAEVKRMTGGRQTPTSREETLIFDYPLLQLPPEKPGFVKRVKRKTVAIVKGIQSRLTQTDWQDRVKPDQFRGRHDRLIKMSHLQPGEEQEPEPGYYPLVLGAGEQGHVCNDPPFGFRGCEGARKGKDREGAERVYSFPRVDGSKGLLYVTHGPRPVPVAALVQDSLAFDYSAIGPVHKDFLQRGRNSEVVRETGLLHGRRVTFLVTRSVHDSGMGSMTRLYYHLLYTGELGTLRLTTAGGHHPERKDINSFRHSAAFEAAVRELFERFIFPESRR